MKNWLKKRLDEGFQFEWKWKKVDINGALTKVIDFFIPVCADVAQCLHCNGKSTKCPRYHISNKKVPKEPQK